MFCTVLGICTLFEKSWNNTRKEVMIYVERFCVSWLEEKLEPKNAYEANVICLMGRP
jgi:hypothetical protein